MAVGIESYRGWVNSIRLAMMAATFDPVKWSFVVNWFVNRDQLLGCQLLWKCHDTKFYPNIDHFVIVDDEFDVAFAVIACLNSVHFECFADDRDVDTCSRCSCCLSPLWLSMTDCNAPLSMGCKCCAAGSRLFVDPTINRLSQLNLKFIKMKRKK